MKILKTLFGITLLLAISINLSAQIDKIVGRWTTIDDEKNIPVSIINIYRSTDGLYYGQIERILVKGEENKLCTECEGTLHNKPVVGMVIVKNMESGEQREVPAAEVAESLTIA